MHALAPNSVEVFRPHGTKLIVRVEKLDETITPGGIHLPRKDPKTIEAVRGEVVAVGSGWRHEKDGFLVSMPLPWKVGDTVIFLQGRVTCPIKVNDEEFIALDECDVLGLVDIDS